VSGRGDREADRALSSTAASMGGEVQRIMTIPGIGLVLGITIYGEIGDISRFGRPEKLCAYAGIVPSVRNSAETVHHGRITRRGSGVLRWAAVEAVQFHLMYCPKSDISRFYRRLAKKRGAGKAKVAAASKMLRVIHRMLVMQSDFAPHAEE